MVNLLRIDPSRTTLLRRQFERDIRSRFTILKRQLIQLIVKEDALGLRPWKAPWEITHNVSWSFLTSPRKVDEFKRWVAVRVGMLFLKSQPDQSSNSWLQEYINKAYQRGLNRAWTDWRKPTKPIRLDPKAGAIYQQGQQAEFMRKSFGGPVSVDKLKLLAGRSYDDLDGITAQMSTQITRTLADGLVAGQGPRDIGARLAKVVDNFQTRGVTLARTEILRAHNEGALDGLEQLGVKQVGIMVEWSTAGDDRVCPQCADMRGVVLKIDEARGMFPRHPNCRCVPIPANVGEKTTGQVRSASRITDAISRSLRRGLPKHSKRYRAKHKNWWAGAFRSISKKRPLQ